MRNIKKTFYINYGFNFDPTSTSNNYTRYKVLNLCI